MRVIYLKKEVNGHIRKILLDMAWIVSHKQIRLPKYYLEDGIYLEYLKDPNDLNSSDKYFITTDKVKKEDDGFYYFDFPFKHEQVESTAV